MLMIFAMIPELASAAETYLTPTIRNAHNAARHHEAFRAAHNFTPTYCALRLRRRQHSQPPTDAPVLLQPELLRR